MKRMKLFSTIAVLVLSFSLVACGSNKQASNEATTAKTEQSTTKKQETTTKSNETTASSDGTTAESSAENQDTSAESNDTNTDSVAVANNDAPVNNDEPAASDNTSGNSDNTPAPSPEPATDAPYVEPDTQAPVVQPEPTEHVHKLKAVPYETPINNYFDTEAEGLAYKQSVINDIIATGRPYEILNDNSFYGMMFGNDFHGNSYPSEPKYYLLVNIRVDGWFCHGCATMFADPNGTTVAK